MMSELTGQMSPLLTSILSNPALTEEQRQRLLAALEGMDTTMMQDYLTKLGTMPPEELSVALDALSTPYEAERSDLRDELSQNYDQLTAQGPQGQMAGNNQFSVYVGANPLEHIASGINKYQAGKGLKQNRADLDALSKKEQSATAGAQLSRIEAIQAKMTAEALRNGIPQQSPMPPSASSPGSWLEEELKKRRGY